MKVHYNIKINQEAHPILADIFYPNLSNGCLVVFCHGFKGFKDWGAWHLVAEKFTKEGFVFLKFNFSHNGIGQEDIQSFTRLDLFYKNNYSRELQDLKLVSDWIEQDTTIQALEIKNYYLIGHSRGGGIAIKAASIDKRWNKLITWASISDFDRFGDINQISEWRKEGFRDYFNSRTQQHMRIGIQFYEDYKKHQAHLNIESAAKSLDIPWLIIHGTLDNAVGFSHAKRLNKWNRDSELVLISEADHVFGTKHPYSENQLPSHLLQVCEESITFLNQ